MVTKQVKRHRLTVSTEQVAPKDLTDLEVFEVGDNSRKEVEKEQVSRTENDPTHVIS